ncbi:MAG: hypothetical protein J2P47_00375 [Acetobacteraceae bacterium]|nr:hypothetical protein [Acetobacteraceae bacterium]
MITLCVTLVGCFSVKPPFGAIETERVPTGFAAVAIPQINSMATFILPKKNEAAVFSGAL